MYISCTEGKQARNVQSADGRTGAAHSVFDYNHEALESAIHSACVACSDVCTQPSSEYRYNQLDHVIHWKMYIYGLYSAKAERSC